MKLPTVEYLLVTPAMATEWLNANTHNRRLNQRRVDALAQTLKDGRWQVTHQGVAFGSDGVLYDGQHRLAAIEKSGTSVIIMVVRGLDPSTRSVIDRGAARKPSDNLKISYGLEITATKGAWLSGLASLPSGDYTPAEAETLHDLMDLFHDGYTAACDIFVGNPPKLYCAPYITAFIYAWRENPAKVKEMMKGYVSGANLASDSPVLVLRKFALTTTMGGASVRRDAFLRTLDMITAFIDGKPRKITRKLPEGHENYILERFAKANNDQTVLDTINKDRDRARLKALETQATTGVL